MADPSSVAAALRRDASELRAVPGQVIAAVEADARRVRAGRFAGEPLRVVTRRTGSTPGTAAVELVGAPAGAWSILSYGRRGAYPVVAAGRTLDLRGAGLARTGYRRVRPGPAIGDNRWARRVAEPMADTATRTLGDLVDRI